MTWVFNSALTLMDKKSVYDEDEFKSTPNC